MEQHGSVIIAGYRLKSPCLLCWGEMNLFFQVDVLAQWTPQVNSMFWLFKRIVRGDRGREAHVRQIKLTAPFSFPEIRPTSTWPALPRASPKTKMKQKKDQASILHLPPFSKIHIPNTPADTLLHSNLFEHILTCTLHIATSAFKEIFDFPRICLNILTCILPNLQLKRYLTFLKPNGYYYKI